MKVKEIVREHGQVVFNATSGIEKAATGLVVALIKAGLKPTGKLFHAYGTYCNALGDGFVAVAGAEDLDEFLDEKFSRLHTAPETSEDESEEE